MTHANFSKTVGKRIFVNSMIFLIVFTTVFTIDLPKGQNQALAATNLINGSSFENNIHDDWAVWHNASTTRAYDFFRSYDAPYGCGSYAGAVEASGAPEARWEAGLVNENSFNIDASQTYVLQFYAKGTYNFTISAYIENANTYEAITPVINQAITTDWVKYTFYLNPTNSVPSLLTFTFGDMPAGATLFLDNALLYATDIKVNTPKLQGKIGENKTIKLTGIANIPTEDIAIELPYFDHLTGEITRERFAPESRTTSAVTLKFHEQTFSGMGEVYVNDILIGEFDYHVLPVIEEIIPILPRAEEDLTIVGSGFSPEIDIDKMFIILNTVDINGKKHNNWLKPHTIDSKLSQITATLPYGIAPGKLYVQTGYINKNSEDVTIKSNSINYKVKPVIFGLTWSNRGYDQVGDKITILGKGISSAPTVTFYDMDGKKIQSARGKVVDVYSTELIEADVPTKINEFLITVTVAGIESDMAEALELSAKPVLATIKTKNKRTVYGCDEIIQAAKVGEEITLTGLGFVPTSASTTLVEWQGVNTRITTEVLPAGISVNGTSLQVTVPAGAQNGYINVIANGEESNYLPLEIIPTVLEIAPNPVAPGQMMWINATGVGSNLELAKVHFNLGQGETITVQPTSLDVYSTVTVIHARAPLALSSTFSSINVQYDRWIDSENEVLNVTPHITGASINLDNNILTIKGYGFSVNPKENIITYMYADEERTVIDPKVKVLGVYPTAEGQGIRVQILDDYFYGYIRVSVGELTSNDAQFGPVMVKHIARRVEYVGGLDQVMGVLYISGYNFGSEGGVMVGNNWADIHYRSDNFIIAVIDQAFVYDNPVIVARP